MSMQSDLSTLTRNRGGAPVESNLGGVPLPARRWKTRVLLPGAIGLVTLVLVGIASRELLLSAKDVVVVPVVAKADATARTESGVIVQAPGWVEADPFPVAVSALANGVVKEVLVLEGDRVEAGQVVARLVDDDAKIAVAEAEAHLAELQSALASAKAMHREAQQNWDHPIELTRARDTLTALLAERRAELARWPAEVAREEAATVSLRADLDRIEPLHKSGRASEIEFIRAKQAYEVQKAEVEKVRLRKPVLEAQVAGIEADLVAARERLELRIADSRALADAEATLRRAEAGAAKAKAMRDAAALTLSRMEVRSPAAGVVMARLAEPGAKLMLNMDNPNSAQAVRLYNPDKLQVRVDVPLADAAKIGVGQPAEVIVDVLPDRVFAGHISRLVHQADVQKNTLQVKVAIEKPIAELKPEMLARARFLGMPDQSESTDSKPVHALYVPSRAVIQNANGVFIWLADSATKTARRRAVKTGRKTTGGYSELREGVQPGDRVIIDAPPDLADGDRIRIVSEAKEAPDGLD